MKLNKAAAALLLICAASTAQASSIDYAVNVTDSHNDTFVGIVNYDTTLDVLTSASGTLTFADSVVVNNFFLIDQSVFPGYSGTVIAAAFFGSPSVWLDGVANTTYTNTEAVVLLLDSTPSIPNPILDPNAYIIDDTGTSYQITSGGMTVPEPASIALLAAGLSGFGLPRRKSNQRDRA